jgi:hypothetical protein
MGGEAEALNERGSAAFKLGKLEEALALYTQARAHCACVASAALAVLRTRVHAARAVCELRARSPQHDADVPRERAARGGSSACGSAPAAREHTRTQPRGVRVRLRNAR